MGERGRYRGREALPGELRRCPLRGRASDSGAVVTSAPVSHGPAFRSAARIRGTLLMAYSNKFNSMLLACGNKSELATGYCTLYGDTVGGLLPIGDLFKTEVYELCKQINEQEKREGNTEIFPQVLINKPPSAELRFNQKDSDSLPPYDVLDTIPKLHLNEGLTAEEIAGRGIDGDLAAQIIRTVTWAEFKRRQMPPILKIKEQK